MLITIEQQQAIVDNYAKDHTPTEVFSFVDGMAAMLDLIQRIENNKNK